MKISELETPFLLLDKSKVQKNLQRMENKLQTLGVKLRPHGKTAKSIDVINMLAPQNRQGVTVSTLKEAEYYFNKGIDDIVYAVGISPNKLIRAAGLLKQGANLTLILDSMTQIQQCITSAKELDVQFPFLIEIDADGDRGGIRPEDNSLLDIAKFAAEHQEVCLKGILTHAGGSYKSKTTDEIVVMAEQERSAAVESAKRLKEAGIHCEVVSVGSTPTAMFSGDLSGITEVRAGVFMFQDLVMHGLGVCDMDDIALSVGTSIIGKNTERNWLLTDAGWMALSRDRGTQGQGVDYGYGQVCDIVGKPLENAIVNATNQEHGIIHSNKIKDSVLEKLEIGSVVRVLPNHACATAAMFDDYLVTEDGETVCDRWTRINGW